MPIRNILVPVLPDACADHQLDAALRVARRVSAHVNALFIRSDPAIVYAALPRIAVTAGVTVEKIDQEESDQAAEARQQFESWRDRNSLSRGPVQPTLRSTYACWGEVIGLPEVTVIRHGRLSDLIVLNMPAADAPLRNRVFDAALFDSGRPVLLVPTVVPDDLLRHVMIAWNGSLEATRAVAAALPILHEAEGVTVLTAPWHEQGFFEEDVETDDNALAESLVWHGISARCGALKLRGSEEADIGATLLEYAVEHGATLLVMGAFTRSRIRQFLLGGVTRHVLRCAPIPVLMAH